MRRREQERPRAVIQKLDERAAAGDVAAERADRLRQRAHLDVDAAVHAEMIDRTTAASVFLKAASRRSSSMWMSMVPAIVRTDPDPTPSLRVASSAASRSLGCVVRPR